MLTQEEIIAVLKDLIIKAPVYKKFKEVYARRSVEGEKVETYIGGIKETQNVAKSGDYVVKNMTDSEEEYILPSDKFQGRYEYKSRFDDTWDIYMATGKCRALLFDNEIKELIGKEKEFKFIAAWGEEMICQEGDWLACPSAEGEVKEIYRIAGKEFQDTYKIIED